VIRAAKRYGSKSLGVTLSQEQYKYAVALAEKEGVNELASFTCMNYLDLKITSEAARARGKCRDFGTCWPGEFTAVF